MGSSIPLAVMRRSISLSGDAKYRIPLSGDAKYSIPLSGDGKKYFFSSDTKQYRKIGYQG